MRLPKWMQAKFAERLKRLEGEGHAMPTFKHVVDFLRERAFILNHPFFSAGSRENVVSKFKSRGKPPVTPKPAFFVNMTAAKGEPCPMCCQSHRLYQCEAFKSKSPNLRGKEMTLSGSTKYVLTASVHLYTTQENASQQSGVKWKAVDRHITRCYIFMNQRK